MGILTLITVILLKAYIAIKNIVSNMEMVRTPNRSNLWRTNMRRFIGIYMVNKWLFYGEGAITMWFQLLSCDRVNRDYLTETQWYRVTLQRVCKMKQRIIDISWFIQINVEVNQNMAFNIMIVPCVTEGKWPLI